MYAASSEASRTASAATSSGRPKRRSGVSRTSAAIRPRTLQHIRDEFTAHGVPALQTQMQEREAFRAIFSFGGTIDGLKPGQVGGLEGAMRNARAFAAEVVALLRRAQPAEAAPATPRTPRAPPPSTAPASSSTPS